MLLGYFLRWSSVSHRFKIEIATCGHWMALKIIFPIILSTLALSAWMQHLLQPFYTLNMSITWRGLERSVQRDDVTGMMLHSSPLPRPAECIPDLALDPARTSEVTCPTEHRSSCTRQHRNIQMLPANTADWRYTGLQYDVLKMPPCECLNAFCQLNLYSFT